MTERSEGMDVPLERLVGHCCYGGVKPKSACANCAAWRSAEVRVVSDPRRSGEWARHLPTLQVRAICLAYNTGFRQSASGLKNPYTEGGAQHAAYEFGKEDANGGGQ